MTDMYLFFMILTMAGVTLLLRFLPFIIFRGKKETPEFVDYLGRVLPFSIVAMLVIYCLKGIDFIGDNQGIPEIIASLTVVVLHVWKRNNLLSIITGTALYMILVQLIF